MLPNGLLLRMEDGKPFPETRDIGADRVGKPLFGSSMEGGFSGRADFIVNGSRQFAKYVPKLK